MKKAVVFFLSCTLLASMLAGCGSENGQKNTENGKVEKENVEENKVEGKLTVAVTEDRVKYYEPVFNEFVKEYPDVEVEYATFADFTATNQGIQAAYQAGDDYDLITVNHVDTMTF